MGRVEEPPKEPLAVRQCVYCRRARIIRKTLQPFFSWDRCDNCAASEDGWDGG